MNRTDRRPTRRHTLAVLTAAAVTSLLTACGGATSTTAATPTTSLDPAAAARQDAAFATALFDHRHQALQLVGLAAQYATSSDLLQLTRSLQTTYDTQMRDLGTMLTAWGQPVPHVEGHSDLGDTIPGLLDKTQLADLRAAEGSAFDTKFLQILDAHEQAAEPLARKELTSGADPQAKALAQTVLDDIATHRATIAQLTKK